MALVAIGDRKLQFHRSGSGPDIVVLVPGGSGLTLDYLNVIHEFLPTERFTVISYNPSGTFGNENAPFHKSVKAYAEELRNLLDVLKIDSCWLFGHSWGGVIVQEFLFQHPSYPTKGAILANSFTSGVAFSQSLKNRANDLSPAFHESRVHYLKQGNGDGLDSLVGEYWIPKHLCRVSPLPKELLSSLTPLADSPLYYYYLGHDLLNLSGAMLDWDRSNQLKDIKCPVLIMSGEYDYLTLQENEEITNQIPNGKLWYGKNTSHLPMFEQTKEFCGILVDFLNQNT